MPHAPGEGKGADPPPGEGGFPGPRLRWRAGPRGPGRRAGRPAEPDPGALGQFPRRARLPGSVPAPSWMHIHERAESLSIVFESSGLRKLREGRGTV